MTPTRDRLRRQNEIDTGTGSKVADRPDTWAYRGPADTPASDTGIGSPVARRPDTLDNGDTFIPPLWR